MSTFESVLNEISRSNESGKQPAKTSEVSVEKSTTSTLEERFRQICKDSTVTEKNPTNSQ